MPTFEDNDFQIVNQADNTKRAFFNLASMTTGIDTTIALPALAAGAHTMAFIDVAQTLASKTFSNNADFQGGVTVAQGTGSHAVAITADIANYPGNPSIEFIDPTSGKTLTLLQGNSRTDDRAVTLPNAPGQLVVVGDGFADIGNTILTKIDLTGQSAGIASTPLTVSAPSGYYLVHYTLADTTTQVGVATAQFGISYTDDAGATTQAGAALTLTATGRDRGALQVYLASGNINYSVTVTGVIGTARYALRVRIEALG